MSGNITFNPNLTTNAAGLFSVQSDGYVQGMVMDDPAVRFALAGGAVASTETLPMWGGIGIFEDINTASQGVLGSTVGRATALTSLIGFSVFNQAHSWINSPQSQVPTGAPGMFVPYYRLGSGARIPVACDPALISLDGGLVTQQVSWDFDLQRLIPYVPLITANVFTAMSWSAGVVTGTTTSAHGLSPGMDVTISGVTPAGYNGDVTLIAGTTGSTIKYNLATDPGSVTVQGQLDAQGGALNVKVLQVKAGNSKTVSYDSTTGFANWNEFGACALILV